MTAARPFLFLRVSFDVEDPSRGWERGAMGNWVRDIFVAEKEALLEDIIKARSAGTPRVLNVLQNEARWCVGLLSDIDQDLLMPTGPRRMRIYRGGQGEWVQEVLREEQAALYDDLGRLRTEGRSEEDPEVEDVRRKLQWSVNLLRDVDAVLISLVGPDEDTR